MELLRQLEIEHKKLWDNLSSPSSELIEASDCTPELLSGWTDRDISLWDVTAKDGKPGLQQILVALCRNKKDWDKISYLLFPKERVSSAGLVLTESNGKTGDSKVDTSKTHFEIKGITGKELCTFLFMISSGEFTTGKFTKREFEKILFEIYDSTKTQQVTESATSQKTQISSPSTGTMPQEATKELIPERIRNETTATQQKPEPSSSNTTT